MIQKTIISITTALILFAFFESKFIFVSSNVSKSILLTLIQIKSIVINIELLIISVKLFVINIESFVIESIFVSTKSNIDVFVLILKITNVLNQSNNGLSSNTTISNSLLIFIHFFFEFFASSIKKSFYNTNDFCEKKFTNTTNIEKT